jgi:alanyl-tRNA synthetase
MGLERAAAVLQNVNTNFHIDILRPLVEAAAEICGVRYEPESESGRRLRRIADHIRACTFAIHENVYPGPHKEKYVIRRLLRRAVLDGHQLGRQEPFLYELAPVVAQLMQHPYPEMCETSERVAQAIRSEESSFLATIDDALRRIRGVFGDMEGSGHSLVQGPIAAELYQPTASHRNWSSRWRPSKVIRSTGLDFDERWKNMARKGEKAPENSSRPAPSNS